MCLVTSCWALFLPRHQAILLRIIFMRSSHIFQASTEIFS